MAVLHDNAGNPIGSDNPLATRQIDSDIIIPVDVQARLSETIQTHNAVSVGASTGTSDSAWVDTDGFTEVGITIMNDAGTASLLHIYWSNDGVTNQGAIYNALTGTDNLKSYTTPTRARYIKVRLGNTDAIAHVMSAWVYLKA
jgi:hypothetical protein